MKRTRFLQEKWRRYPVAENDWLDVEQFIRASASASAYGPPLKVCGRIEATQNPRSWLLGSAGAQIEFSFAPDCLWGSEGDGIVDVEVLQSGDLLCVELSSQANLTTHRCRLLAPSTKQFKLVSEFNHERSVQWARMLSEIRAFFDARDFIEMQTPTLVPSPGTEPFLDPFSTVWETASGRQTLFLPTSPEFHLKKLLATGWTRIFELKTCFRNGELGTHHQPEFMMLEWYRAFSSLERVADDVGELISWLAERLVTVPGYSRVWPQGKKPQLVRTTMREVFFRAFKGFELRPDTTRDELLKVAADAEVRCGSTDTWDEVYFRLFLEKIENSLAELMQTDGPVLIHGYPPSQAALARIGADGFADRFEVYWRGFELANAFHELNDAVETLVRFNDDAAKKRDLSKSAVPLDQGLLNAVEFGLPPSGGIALGVDRLFMAFFGIKEITKTRPFPFNLQY
jgi:lysyl-tRNA synthetase class 2